jgi:hypothetical protein
MRRDVPLISAALVALVAMAVGATTASAGDPFVKVRAAKHKDGPYLHNPQGLMLPAGESKTLYWRVKNIAPDQKLELRFDDAATDPEDDYRVRWFKGHENITSDVSGPGFEFKLKAGAKKLFSARVKHRTNSGILCLGGQASGSLVNPDAAYFNVNGPCT